jgi:hypothetical protein
VPGGAAHPRLRAANILDDHRSVVARRGRRLPLNPEARLEQVVRWRRQLAHAFPWHRALGILLARRDATMQAARRNCEPCSVRASLQDELARIRSAAIVVARDIEADHAVAFRQEALGPTARRGEFVRYPCRQRVAWPPGSRGGDAHSAGVALDPIAAPGAAIVPGPRTSICQNVRD